MSPVGCGLNHRGMHYALDSGAWAAFLRKQPFDFQKYVRAVALRGQDADWVVLPDIVAGGLPSLGLSLLWLEKLKYAPVRKWLIAVQDGMEPSDLQPFVSGKVGIFIGGSTEWKLASLPKWGQFCRERQIYLHVGRVNSALRIRYAAACGAESFDGTSATRFALSLPRLEAARQFTINQGRLFHA